jgi:hypothetical protein
MCRLKIKIKLAGSKHHKFKKLVIFPRNFFINSNFKTKIGIYDTRVNKNIRYIIINIYTLMSQYKFGLTPNKKSLNILYYFFIKSKFVDSNVYFSKINLNIF